MSNSETIYVRVPKSVKAAVEKEAHTTQRTMAVTVARLLEYAIRKKKEEMEKCGLNWQCNCWQVGECTKRSVERELETEENDGKD